MIQLFKPSFAREMGRCKDPDRLSLIVRENRGKIITLAIHPSMPRQFSHHESETGKQYEKCFASLFAGEDAFSHSFFVLMHKSEQKLLSEMLEQHGIAYAPQTKIIYSSAGRICPAAFKSRFENDEDEDRRNTGNGAIPALRMALAGRETQAVLIVGSSISLCIGNARQSIERMLSTLGKRAWVEIGMQACFEMPGWDGKGRHGR